MKPFHRFLLIEILKLIIPIILMLVVLYSSWNSTFSLKALIPIFILVVMGLAILIYNLYRIKKYGIDMNKPENMNGNLTHTFSATLPMSDIETLLKRNQWKFKFEGEKIEDHKKTISLKNKTFGLAEYVNIQLEEHGKATLITITSIHPSKWMKWISKTNYWGNALRNIDYLKELLHQGLA